MILLLTAILLVQVATAGVVLAAIRRSHDQVAIGMAEFYAAQAHLIVETDKALRRELIPPALRHDELLCPGCDEIVPKAVAYRDGPRPFHWNDQGGGHTMDPAAYQESR